MKHTQVHPWAIPPARAHRPLGPQRLRGTSANSSPATSTFASPGLFWQGSTAPQPTAHINGVEAESKEHSNAEESNASAKKYIDRLLVRKSRRLVIVKTEDLQLIEAAGNYVRLVTDENTHLLRTPLSELADQLDPQCFLRVHRSAIINTECLEAVETNPAGDYFLKLEGGQRLKCSRSYRQSLRAFLQGLG